jgi:hypothetical protein
MTGLRALHRMFTSVIQLPSAHDTTDPSVSPDQLHILNLQEERKRSIDRAFLINCVQPTLNNATVREGGHCGHGHGAGAGSGPERKEASEQQFAVYSISLLVWR